jgi:hypothetical protein
MTSTARPPAPTGAQSAVPIATRKEALRDALPQTWSLLKAHRASDIAEQDIDDYVALNWMEWNGGSLQLTVTGSNVCQQARMR